jgi:DNA-binding XRE family transcriptional regulator
MKRYTITQEQLAKLIEASRPVPYMIFGGREPPSVQECANAAWATLGKEMGFDHMTVRPVSGEPQTVFIAEPTGDGK